MVSEKFAEQVTFTGQELILAPELLRIVLLFRLVMASLRAIEFLRLHFMKDFFKMP